MLPNEAKFKFTKRSEVRIYEAKRSSNSRSEAERSSYNTPCAIIAFATFMKPAIFAPFT